MGVFTDDQIAAMSASTVRAAVLVEMQFASETVRVWAGDYPMNSGGHQWLPLKGYGQIDNLNLLMDGSSSSTSMTLSGLPDQVPDFLAQVLLSRDEVNQRPAIIYMQLFDANWQIVGAPTLLTYGYMQPPQVSRGAMSDTEGAQQGIKIDLISAFSNRARPAFGMLTDRDQQKRHPGDMALQYTAQLANGVTTTYPDY